MPERPTLVLDLDETLVFSTMEPKERVDFELHLAGQVVYVQVRPETDRFLIEMRKRWNVMFWSTGQPIYVDAIVDRLGVADLPAWGRDKCRRLDEIPENHHEPFDKPLDRVGVPMERVVIVDNAPGTFAANPDNGIPITAWHGDLADRQLDVLGHYLDWLALRPDIRRDHWKWSAEVVLMRNVGAPGRVSSRQS